MVKVSITWDDLLWIKTLSASRSYSLMGVLVISFEAFRVNLGQSLYNWL